VNTKKEMVTVNVIGFKLVHDQNGRGWKYFILAAVYEFGLNISNCSRQGMINGKIWRTNIKDKRALLKSTFYDTGWKWRVESAKAIRYQTSSITNSWLEDAEISDDLKAKTEAQFRLNYELQNF
jgi:hypothetical protein